MIVTVIENVALFPKFFTFILGLKSNPIIDLDRPVGFQEVEAPRFQDNQHISGLDVSVNDNSRVQETTVLPVDQVPPGRRVSPCEKH
jgi:hypothetical protein